MVDRYTFEFSGGMRQRAMIAMALACNPELLIADEPTTALDVTTQAEILDLIKRLQAEHGMAVMFITHDMGVVAEIADEVAVMRCGKVVEHGTRRRHLPPPQNPYTGACSPPTLKLEQPRALRAAPPAHRPSGSRCSRCATSARSTAPRPPGSARSRDPGQGGGRCQLRSLSRREPGHRRRERLGQDDDGAADAARRRAQRRACSYRDARRRAGQTWSSLDRRPAARAFTREVRMVFQDPFALAQSAHDRAARSSASRCSSTGWPRARRWSGASPS